MQESRTQLNIKIDAKTHYIATLAARHKGMTLAVFVESLISKGITKAGMSEPEPNTSEPRGPIPGQDIWEERLWSEDDATRLFNLATFDPSLLTRSQLRIWTKFTSKIAADRKKLSIKTFRDYYITKDDE